MSEFDKDIERVLKLLWPPDIAEKQKEDIRIVFFIGAWTALQKVCAEPDYGSLGDKAFDLKDDVAHILEVYNELMGVDAALDKKAPLG